MTGESKLSRHKEKSKSRRNKAKVVKNQPRKKSKTSKISEEYLNEEKQIENTIKVFNANISKLNLLDNDYEKQKQDEDDFFCDPFSSVKLDIPMKIEVEQDEDKISRESDAAHSIKSNESPNTHLASTFMGQDHEEVIKKFELTRITIEEADLFFQPKVLPLMRTIDEEIGVRRKQDEGFFIPQSPEISNETNKCLLIDRICESGASELLDDYGRMKNSKKLVDDDLYRLVSDKVFTPIFVSPKPITFDKFDKIVQENRFLKILIEKLMFDQHHLFTQEHQIAKIVERIFSEYERRKKLDVVGVLRQKLMNLRELKTQQNTSTPTSESSKSRTLKNEEIALNNQIKIVRQKYHVERKYDSLVMRNLLENWKMLKTTRNRQSSALTDVSLKIFKVDVDVEKKKEDWQREYDVELEEMMNEAFEEYHMMKKKYKEFVKNITDPEAITTAGKSSIKKPKKPEIDQIIAELNEIYSDKSIDDPEINIFLARVKSSGKSSEKSKKIKKINYRIDLEIDGEIVGSTKTFKLDDGNFSVQINSAFIMKLTKQLPDSLKIIIYEIKSAINKLSEIVIPLPDDEENFEESQSIELGFSSKRLSRRNSNQNSRFSASFKRNGSRRLMNISGRIEMKIGWSDSVEKSEAPTAKIDRSKISGTLSKTTLKTWFETNLLNPLDPDAENLIRFMKQDEDQEIIRGSSAISAKNKLFRFNEEDLALCSQEEFDSIERFQVLRARHDNDLNYRSRKFIPQLERELEFDKDKDMNIIDESSIVDPIDLQRFHGKKYLKKVYETISNHCDVLNKDKMNMNLLIGDDPPTFSSLSSILLEIFGPKRPLKPIRRTTSSRASCKFSDVSDFNLVVMVVRATNVPVRNDEPTQTSSRKSSQSNQTNSKFAPFKMNGHPHVFVTVSLKDHHHTSRTSSAEGTNPIWNEQLKIPFNVKSDLSKRMLSIDLYDEVVEDLIDNVTEVYQRITSKWLGNVKIPIANIFANQRIEGIFEVSIPSILLGYSKPKFGDSRFFNENLPQMSFKTHIHLFINLEPQVEIPKLITSGLECIEVENVERHIKNWYQLLKIEFPSRASRWNPLVTLLTGKKTCITRLLHPLTFPFPKQSIETIERKIRRYISLIPVINDVNISSSSCTGLHGVWLSNLHILGLMTSSFKDLGVLLTCFLLELGVSAWLVLGSSSTCGECCFVLTRESNNFYIIDPSTGKKYISQDVNCPLTACYCVVNQYNVWANLQREERIFLTHFDVNRGLEWRPMFQKVVDIPNETVHDLSFKFERSFDTRDLQRTIQAKIVKKINSWRSNRKTVWNR